jgi:aspartate aminotransferase-like enzyme
MFVPGPVDVAPEVLAAQTRPMLPHRSKEFEELFRKNEERVKQVFYTQYRVFQGACSGSGMQEAGIRNFVQESVLSCVNGAFAQRWNDVAVSNGKQADKLEVEFGEAITPEMLRDALKRKHYEAVTIVHNETSTGVQNPVQELCKVVHEVSPDTLILVDAVSSLAGVKIEMDAWGIDFMLTSSQKCFALPPGLALAAASDRAMKKAESVSNRGWYFDLLLMEKHRLKDSTPMTPAMSLIFALDKQLDRILEEGLENRFARHAAMSKKVQDFCIANGMEPLAKEPYRSRTVVTVKNELKWDISALNKFLQTRGMRIANGYGKIKDLTYRVATMGETTMEDIDKLLLGFTDFMKQ